jgi:hypothetical protein
VPAERFVENDAERVDVTRRGGRFAGKSLRGQIGHRAGHASCQGQVGALPSYLLGQSQVGTRPPHLPDHLAGTGRSTGEAGTEAGSGRPRFDGEEVGGYTEVGELPYRRARVGFEDVAGLHVTVDHASSVRRIESAENVVCDATNSFDGHRPGVHLVTEGTPRQHLHDEERHTAIFADVEDGHHVGMGEASRHPGFLFEPAQNSGIPGQFGPQDLERYRSVQKPVPTGIDLTHPTEPQHRTDRVASG